MKKIITAGILVLFATATGYAQSPFETIGPYAIHIKAVRNFYDRYGDGNNESWYATGYGFRAKFRQDGISFMADYDKKGGWVSTIKTYDENKLPKDIRAKIRREYYDHQIFLVQEIDQRNETVYLVSLEEARSWMILRLAGDEMETVAAFEK